LPAEPPIPDVLTPDELEALFAAVSGRSKTALRNRALLMVMHDAALRSAEVVKLRPADVDVPAGNVSVRNGKGRKPRLIRDCLHPETREALSAWLTRRETLGWDGRKAMLFGTFYTRPERGSGDNSAAKGGGPLDTSYLRRLLPKLAAKAKLTKEVSPHLLRHTRAREWSDEGRPTADIQQALGHKSLATTSIYLARLAPAGMGAGQRGRGALDTDSYTPRQVDAREKL
jgi:integrase/recombinase XerD